MRHSARVNARIRYSKIATCTVLSLNEYSLFVQLQGQKHPRGKEGRSSSAVLRNPKVLHSGYSRCRLRLR
ncbi:hypothetical protein T440DRAFT_247525 [Plenodomus tracheiphilus IPT5]|uniref:Uncharacterized protein n=1 Tax=Plenodomus tracheiphilus IPT5 TaxID=1408161 RepID=A0A6A7AVD0_9PLEO|nr:hypothetical protein T440DRAFT_247525 [Plenodomus tracheiphilus IPT5]